MKYFILGLAAFVFFFSTSSVQAKVLPRFAKSATKTTTAKSTGGIKSSVKFMAGKTGITVNFSNLTAAKTVSYTLSYATNGKQEGVVGSVPTTSVATSRELLFGTCSSGTCKYHKNITNASLTINTTLLSGKKTVKRFKLKV